MKELRDDGPKIKRETDSMGSLHAKVPPELLKVMPVLTA